MGAGAPVDVLSPRAENRVSVAARCRDRDGLLEAPEAVDEVPHVAVVGRVNAGKSSFCNHLLRKSNLTKASSVAGRTDSVNFLLCNEQLVLADLPGYPAWDGDARAPRDWVERLGPLMQDYLELGGEGYFDTRAVLWLHDPRWRVTQADQQFVALLRRLGLPTLLVLTKDDRLEGHEDRTRRTAEVRQSLEWEGPHVHYCARNDLPQGRKARKQVQRYVRSFVQAGGREECGELLRGAWSQRGGDKRQETVKR